MTALLCSVVIPAYNAQSTIGSAIRSVLAQTHRELELLVVDDGSLDDTASVVDAVRDPRVVLLRQENRGVSAARNAGITAASGTYVSFLDSDDLWLPGYLAAMTRALDSDPEAGLAYTDAWLLDDATRRIRRATIMSSVDPRGGPPENPLDLLRLLIRRNFIYVSTTVRRSVLDVVGGFRGSVSPAEDYELWLRLVARGFRVVRAEGTLCIYRDRENSASADLVALAGAERKVYESLGLEPGLPSEIRAALRERVADCDARLSGLRRRPGRDRRRTLRELARGWLRGDAFFQVPPAEVGAAFPDLSAL